MKNKKNKINYFDLKKIIINKIIDQGGWVNAHCHLDRAYTLTKNSFKLTNATLKEKWELIDEIKKESSVQELYDRMAYALESFINQKIFAVGSFIDVDEVIKDKAIKAAEKIKERFKKSIKIKFINQVLKGVIDKKARYWFDFGSQFVDIIGGLPGRDKGKEEQHLEIILGKGRELKKMVHVHVDQLNTAKERETELLIKKTLELGMNNKVVAIHSISLATHPQAYRNKIYLKAKKAGLMFISCPTAWIDSRRSEEKAPIHNAVTPIDEIVQQNLIVALGTDNICDIYKPFNDGQMWTELRFLLESNHFYEIDQLVKIATVNGLKVLGISND